jgi:peptide deformylase
MFNLFKKKEPKKEEPKPEIKKDIRPIVANLTELRKPCLPVEKGENVKDIIQALKDTLEVKKGWGLSANQIGINKRISYIKIPKFVDKNKQIQYNEFVLINAKIIEHDRPIKVMDEGCLSFPGIRVHTRRYVFITIEYLNEKMEPQAMSYQDMESICIQHEVDHTLGITIFDRKWKAK